MKRCPKCNAEYFDNMLEFCLEDGTRLNLPTQEPGIAATPVVQQRPAVVQDAGPITNRNSEETVVIRDADKRDKNFPVQNVAPAEASPAAKLLESAPVVLALAHNWWQWLYLEKQYVYSITDYILSANFLMWLLLLVSGTAVSLLALKHSKNKTLGIIGLVTLAINLLLFLVPRR